MIARLRARLALAWLCLRIRLKVLRWWWRVFAAVLSLFEPVPAYVFKYLSSPLELADVRLGHVVGANEGRPTKINLGIASGG